MSVKADNSKKSENLENVNIAPAIIYEDKNNALKILASMKKIYQDTISRIGNDYLIADAEDHVLEKDENGDLVRKDVKTGKILCKVSNKGKEINKIGYDKIDIEK